MIRSFTSDSSPIRYHRWCLTIDRFLCFRDDVYLCICAANQSRVECFPTDTQSDRCSSCLAGGRCLRGDLRRSTDFLCLCPECYSGRYCQFNTRSFVFTLDQLFSPDLLSSRKATTVSLLGFFSLFAFFLSIPNNLFTFVTLRRRSCLHHGIGHYLLWMSVVNQLSLALLVIRLVHLVLTLTTFQSHPLFGDILCKLLNYFLTCVTRLSYWLPSFVALERAFSTLFLNEQWFKRPHIARSLMFVTLTLVLLSAGHELVFVRAFIVNEDGHYALCVFDLPISHRSVLVILHQTIAVVNFLLPLLINIGCTCTIILIVIRIKMNIQLAKKKCKWCFSLSLSRVADLFLST